MSQERNHSCGRLKTRREFIKDMAVVTTAIAGPAISQGAWAGRKVTLFVISDASDSTLNEPPIHEAVGQLRNALQARGLITTVQHNLEGIHDAAERIVIVPGESSLARQIADHARASLPQVAESLALVAGSIRKEPGLMATGSDVRGLAYGILELADRITYTGDPVSMLRSINQSVEQPANSIRSMTRLFVSDIEDKPWYVPKCCLV